MKVDLKAVHWVSLVKQSVVHWEYEMVDLTAVQKVDSKVVQMVDSKVVLMADSKVVH